MNFAHFYEGFLDMFIEVVDTFSRRGLIIQSLRTLRSLRDYSI